MAFYRSQIVEVRFTVETDPEVSEKPILRGRIDGQIAHIGWIPPDEFPHEGEAWVAVVTDVFEEVPIPVVALDHKKE